MKFRKSRFRRLMGFTFMAVLVTALYNVDWFGGSATDTAIYTGSDLLAVVQDTTNVSMSRDSIYAEDLS